MENNQLRQFAEQIFSEQERKLHKKNEETSSRKSAEKEA